MEVSWFDYPWTHGPPGDGPFRETLCPRCTRFICDCICPDLTGYSKKRRLLREHRKTMRAYEKIIDESDQMPAFLDRLDETDAQHWCLNNINFTDLDETSDMEDPNAELRKERDTTQASVQAAKDALEAEALRCDLERNSMELEDLRGRLLQSR